MLQQKELIEKLVIGDLTRQEPFLVKEGDEVEPEELNHIEDSKKQGNVMTEESSKTTISYDFKINNLWMIAGTSQENEQTLEFVREKEQNIKSVQIKTKMTRTQNQKETKESPGSTQKNDRVVIEEEDDSLISMKIKEMLFQRNDPMNVIGEGKRLFEDDMEVIKEQGVKDEREAIRIKQFQRIVNKQQAKEEEVHYCEQKQRYIIETDDVEERLIDSLMNSFET